MSQSQTDFTKYRGDGQPPPGRPALRRPGQSGRYLPEEGLMRAVNTALIVEQPLLLLGAPGTGKTALAWSVATELGLGEVLEFHTRSDSQARDLLYTYDALARLYDVQARDERAKDPGNYVRYQALGLAIQSAARRVVLI